MCKAATVTAGGSLSVASRDSSAHYVSIVQVGILCNQECTIQSIEMHSNEFLGTAHPHLRMGFI
jgi:hypothetical protein